MKTKLLILLAALTLCAASVFADYSGTCGDNLTWKLTTADSTLTISGTGAMKDYTNTNEISAAPWFSYRGRITKVSLPAGLTSIGTYAFIGCYKLTSVTIPNSVTNIGSNVFDGCIGLASVIWDAKNCARQGYSHISYSSSDSISAPFYKIREQITSFALGDSVEYIPVYLCYGMSKLTSITIPNSVTSINFRAFSGCSKLTSIIWNAKNCADFFSYISAPFNDISGQITFTLGNSVEHIPAYLCYGMSKLASITIPNSVTSIGKNAFDSTAWYNNQPDGVVYINKVLYKYKGTMPNNTSIIIKDGTINISPSAFDGCSGLNSVIWNAKNCADFSSTSAPFFSIGEQITSFTLGDSVEHIPAYLCNGMSKLAFITIPNSVTSIGSSAFNGCSDLAKVNITDLTAWCKINFANSSSNPLYCVHNLYLNDVPVTDLVIPNTVDTIKPYVFYNNSNITSVTIPNSVTTIGELAFYRCSRLTGNLTIPDSVTTIGDNAFRDCSKLASITISNSVTSIGIYAFAGCSGLNSVTWNAKNCADFSSTSAPFFSIRGQITSFTLGDSVEHIPAYLCNGMNKLVSITIPNSVTSIGSSAFNGCSGLTSVTWNAKNCADFSRNAPFYGIREQITSFTLGNSVEHIPAYLCNGMSKLTSITIPNNVTSIGSSAFYYCSGLAKVNITDLTAWCKINFADYCSNPLYYAHNLYLNDVPVTDLVIPNTVNTIKPYAFYGTSCFTSLSIPNSVTSIGISAFDCCSYLKKMTVLATTPPTIEAKTFYQVDCSIPVYIPTGSLQSYKNDPYWKEFINLQESNTDIETVTFENGIYTQFGRVICPEPFEIYTITGLNVTDRNGNLSSGVYVVKTPKAARKIVIR